MSDELCYFDASALSKLVLRDEEGSDLAVSLWHRADRVISNRIAYPETFSAIVKARRNGRLGDRDFQPAIEQFEELWAGAAIVELVADIARLARDIVLEHDLSGADAVHVASALSSSEQNPLAFVTWDQRQSTAAASLGLTVTPDTY